MKLIKFGVCILATILLTGCALKDIPMPEQAWQDKSQKILVVRTKTPTTGLYKAGNQGLLDVAISSAVTSQVDKHLTKLNMGWYETLPSEFAALLREKHIKATVSSKTFPIYERNYPNYIVQSGDDKIIVLKLLQAGAIRNYYGFIPLGAPQAYCSIRGELIDAKDNTLWRRSLTVTVPVEGKWDQPPNYPNLSKAVDIAFKKARKELVESFLGREKK